MKSTIFMILMASKYLFITLPEYKMSVSLWKSEGAKTILPTKGLLVIGKIGIIVETILFVVACVIFLLKCLGALPWW